MNYYLYFGGFIIGGVGCYYGYFYIKNKFNQLIANKIISKLDENMNKQESNFIPLRKTQSALISFESGGKQHKICVPYDRTKARHMLRKKVFLVCIKSDETQDKIEITHKTGVPYLLSAEMMGGESIIVMKDEAIIKTYDKHEIPNFLE